MGRVVAVDYGLRRVGLAITDELQIVARGLETLNVRSAAEAVSAICDLVVREEVETVVVGMPLDFKGKKGPKALEVDKFIRSLKAGLQKRIERPVNVVELDERFSSVQAQSMLLEAETRKSRRTREKIDELSAMIILRTYLDRQGV